MVSAMEGASVLWMVVTVVDPFITAPVVYEDGGNVSVNHLSNWLAIDEDDGVMT